jgi:hypothetical protein
MGVQCPHSLFANSERFYFIGFYTMIDAVQALGKMGLAPGMSVTRAISKIGLDISESSSPLEAANRIITLFGGSPVSKPVQADIIAKAMVEHAIMNSEYYQADDAVVIALEKYRKIEKTMPYVFAGSTESLTPSRNGVVKEVKTNDVKARALEIYNREKGKGGTEIAKVIAAELNISFANAYYYVGRVFAKYKS